jgi:hypothetical protein
MTQKDLDLSIKVARELMTPVFSFDRPFPPISSTQFTTSSATWTSRAPAAMYSTDHVPSLRERMFKSRTEVAVGAGLSAVFLVAVGVNMMDSSASGVASMASLNGAEAQVQAHHGCDHPPPRVSCSATASMASGQGLIVFEAQADTTDATYESNDFGFAGVHCHVECNGEDARRLTATDYSSLEYLHFSSEDSLAPTFDYGVLTHESCCIGYCRSYTPECATDYVEQECCHKPKPQRPVPKPRPSHDDDDGTHLSSLFLALKSHLFTFDRLIL